MVTWAQLGLHRKPCGLLNVEGYYDHLLGLFDHAVAEKFLHPQNRAIVLTGKDPSDLLGCLLTYDVPLVDKLITAETT